MKNEKIFLTFSVMKKRVVVNGVPLFSIGYISTIEEDMQR
jgi:hypothetical protein